MSAPPAVPAAPASVTPSRRRRTAVAATVVVVVVLVAVAIGVVMNQRAQDQADAQEATAWQTRIALNAVLVETAEAVGLNVEPRETQRGRLACTRNDGRSGWSYFLDALEAPPVQDVEESLAQVRALWEAKGYPVRSRQMGEAEILTTTTPEGSYLEFGTGPGATVLSGETFCALEHGDPDPVTLP